MKIVLLTDSLGFGGAQRQIANLGVELKKNGHDIHFIRYHKDDFYHSLLDKAGIVPITIESGNVISRLFKIRSSIRKISPDIVVSFMTTPNFCASISSIGKHSWKLIVSERVANEEAFNSKKSLLMKLFQSRYADAIVCNSQCAQKLWHKYFPETKEKLITIYNIVDIPELDRFEDNYANDKKCKILIAARYEKEKNLDGLLRGISALSCEEREKLELHWYGKANVVDDNAETVYDRTVKFIKEHHLENCVFLHPATDKIYSLMASSDYVALFSFKEGLPNAIIEGMTLKKPVIMSKVSDYEILVDSDNGFVCDPNSAQDIANALRHAINTSPEQQKRMGEISYEKIQRICSKETVVKQWEDLISYLTNNKI